MALELIPFPISIIFVLVFGVAAIAVLWKLRRRGKFYLILSNVSLILGVIVLALVFYLIIITLQHGPAVSNTRPTIVPHVVSPTQMLYLIF
jgi:glucan phosphoethanolaminetransferase (alkaline phosphatase superfamily)